MSKFTKGKWICYFPPENDTQEGRKDCDIFSIQGNIGHFIGTISTEEDARLIGAAPELYELVRDFCDEVEAFVSIYDNFPERLTSIAERAREVLERIDEEDEEDEDE